MGTHKWYRYLQNGCHSIHTEGRWSHEMLHTETQMSIVIQYQRACITLCNAAAGVRSVLIHTEKGVDSVVRHSRRCSRGKLGVKSGRGKYDMWCDWVVKVFLSSCMSVGRSLTEHLDMSSLVITAILMERHNMSRCSSSRIHCLL